MLLRIDFRSGRPVYLQVVDQIKAAAAAGTLRPGEALPSIGRLSGELRVNRNAVSKAYAELEGLGLIEVQPGGEYFLKESRRESRQEVRRIALAPQIDLLPGDRLVMFTDGITEGADSNGEEFGEERLIALLRENSSADAAEVRDAILQSVTKFCRGDFADDATLLTVVVDRPP